MAFMKFIAHRVRTSRSEGHSVRSPIEALEGFLAFFLGRPDRDQDDDFHRVTFLAR
jgi:hypothetical protein